VFARNTPLIPGLPIPARLPFTLLFTSLGIYGAQLLKRRDAGLFWLLLVLWLTTGFGLVGYINFKPGYSIGYDLFPDANMHEVRERDYFYTVSFQVWGLLAGIGVAGLYQRLKEGWQARGGAGRLAPLVLGIGALPFVTNFKAASRAHGPAVELARDFAYNLLQSVEPYGIVFTNGDNDTFPLWYIQEVEGIRQDVSVVNLSLANTDWYIRQLRDNPVRRFDPAQAPWFASLAPAEPPPPLHTLSDEEIAALQPRLLSRSLSYRAGRIETAYREGTPLYVKDIVILRLLQENYQRRPVYFSITAGTGSWLGLHRYMTQEGLVLRIHASEPPDSSRLAPGLLGIPVDVPRTDQLVWEVYRYAGLLKADTLVLDPTNSNIATNLSIPPLSLGQAYEFLGDREKSIKNLELAYRLSPSRQLAEVIAALKSGDTASRPADRRSGGDTSR
jgi:hypothetical protein